VAKGDQIERIKKEYTSTGATVHSTDGTVLGPGGTKEKVIVLFVKNPKSPGFTISYNECKGLDSMLLIIELPGLYRDIAFERLVTNN
jgi:hypothetical protein